jgi:alpha-beta hydrolase superfamily lysophospholipase
MTEHIARYERLMRDLAERGWIAFGYDNLGHGNTANAPEELGFIADRNGWDFLLRDVKVFSDEVMRTYAPNDVHLPYCLMGHSMGSFIVRLAAEKYVTPDRLIIMGTGGSNPAAGIGIALTELVKVFRGAGRVSPLVNALAFGNYNKRFAAELDEAPNPWLTTDAEIRKQYAADPFCTFKFTVSAMDDLVTLTKLANSRAWFKSLRKDLPILLVSGREDPVGDFGTGVETVCTKLQGAGHPVTCRLYDGYRHEILNDASHDRVVADILDFLQNAL